jgi:PAS domain S-box-containing protein
MNHLPHNNNIQTLIEGENSQFFFDVLESLPDGIFLVNESGNITFANSELEQLFGYKKNGLHLVPVSQLVPEHLREQQRYHIASYFLNPTRRQMGNTKLRAMHNDGHEFSVTISLAPMVLDNQLIACAVVRDVSQHELVETALRNAEEQVRLLLDSTAESIYGLNMKGEATFCNRACIETLGYNSPEDILGKNMHDLIHHTRNDGTEYPMVECKIFKAFRQGVGSHVDDEVLWRADGSSFPAEYRSFPIHRDGKLIGSVVTFLDITDQRDIEDILRTQQSELTHVARLSMLGEMAAGLAHELNQPLTAMSALAEGALLRLDRNNLNESEFVTVCSKIAADTQRAGDIISRLRNFVQKRKAERSEVDLNQLVSEVLNFTESEVRHEDIMIQFNLCDNLQLVDADPIEIQQVIVNLIRNACDALSDPSTQSNEPRIFVETFNRDNEFMEVVVSDSGSGIPESSVDRLFEPFFTTKIDGLGIGLGICKSIIEVHRGKIWTGPSVLGGACFHFSLPIIRELG